MNGTALDTKPAADRRERALPPALVEMIHQVVDEALDARGYGPPDAAGRRWPPDEAAASASGVSAETSTP